MAVAQALPALRGQITEEEFMRLPSDGRKWELVNGEATEVPAGQEHDVLVINHQADAHRLPAVSGGD